MSIYRKIYEEYYGSIPVDETGKTYDIHHIDGNRNNNDPSNLIALSLQDHYNVHFDKGEYGACIRIKSRMSLTKEEVSQHASEINKERAKKGKHPSQKSCFKEKMSRLKRKEFDEGIHPFCNNDNLAEWARKGSIERVINETHHFLSGDIQRNSAHKLLEQGKHNFQQKVSCPHCNKVGRIGPMKQWHFDNCKLKSD